HTCDAASDVNTVTQNEPGALTQLAPADEQLRAAPRCRSAQLLTKAALVPDMLARNRSVFFEY
ncbi:jg609, partial [Pararge aegeria aegeria]